MSKPVDEIDVSGHAILQMEKRYAQVFPKHNPPKKGYGDFIRKLFSLSKKISKPPRMRWDNFENKRISHRKVCYYAYSGWILVMDESREKKRVITVYRSN